MSDGLPAAEPAAPVGATAVAFRGVSVAFPIAGGKTYPAVAPTSLSVGRREFVGIVGPTGCGKSTLLNVAAGLLAPATGETLVFGTPLSGLNRHAGYLFQQDAVMPWKTARDNVAIALEVAGTPRAEAVERAQQARIIGDHAIDLGRPRDASEVRLLPRFHELHKAIWGQLRAEVMKAYGEEFA